MQQIFHVAAECFPIAKVGGLADVVGALPKYQNNLGVESKVIMPYYETEYVKKIDLKEVKVDWVSLGDKHYEYKIYSIKKSTLGFEIFLVKILPLTAREKVYGYADDVERFLAFSKVAVNFISTSKKLPNVIHCHDHHTGLIPFFCSHTEAFKNLKNVPTLITIHNAQYQGDFGYDKLHYLPKFDADKIGLLEWGGKINPLAAAIKCAWKVSTVSPNYVKELMVKPSGLESLLQHEQLKCTGILNGIDAAVWNTETDPMLIKNYSIQTVAKGRRANKNWICENFNLNPELPIIAFIGRFVYEKGSDLLANVVKTIFDVMDLKVSIVILGSGDPNTEKEMERLKSTYTGKFNCHIGYNETLSHIIYGGADFLLMPSRVEPCGLNQMYAMKYGMIPITSTNGGLYNSVFDIDTNDTGNGFVFKEVSVHEITNAIKRALHIYSKKNAFYSLRKKIMTINHSWDNSAKTYINLYESLTKTSV